MVKLDLNIGEVIGLAENETIDDKQLAKFLKKFSKEELEGYIIKSIKGDDSDLEDDTEEEQEDTDIPEEEPPKEGEDEF